MSAPRPPTHWMLRALPWIHLTVYRAASQLESGSEILARHIAAVRLDARAIPSAPPRDNATHDLERALSMINSIALEGWWWLIDELESSLQDSRIERSWDAASVIEESTDRWEMYGREEVYDLVLLLREAERVISLSSAELVTEQGNAGGSLAAYHMEGVHFYRGFSRVKPVTGRRIELSVASDSGSYQDVATRFKSLLRTVEDARRIGESRVLHEFTPVGGPRGVRLWAFSALLGRVSRPEPIFAPPAGDHLEHLVQFRDKTGEVDLVFEPEVFLRTLQDLEAFGLKSPVTDFQGLGGWGGQSLVIVGWPFGSEFLNGRVDRPTILHWFPLASDGREAVYDALTRVVSARKIAAAVLDETDPDWRTLLARPDVIEVGTWVYYVPAGCDPRLFRLYVEGGFRGVDPVQALTKYRVDTREWYRFITALKLYFRCSSEDRAFYAAENPVEVIERAYPKLEIVTSRPPSSGVPPVADDSHMLFGRRAVQSTTREPVPGARSMHTGGEPAEVPAKNQIMVNGAVLTLHDELYVRVVSRENRRTPQGKLKTKVVESFDPRSRTLTLTREVWLTNAPQSEHDRQVLSRSIARVERRGS